MSAHLLLNLKKKTVGKRNKMQGVSSILLLLSHYFIKIISNIYRARAVEPINHITLLLL